MLPDGGPRVLEEGEEGEWEGRGKMEGRRLRRGKGEERWEEGKGKEGGIRKEEEGEGMIRKKGEEGKEEKKWRRE